MRPDGLCDLVVLTRPSLVSPMMTLSLAAPHPADHTSPTLATLLRRTDLLPSTKLGAVSSLPLEEREGIDMAAVAADAVEQYVVRGAAQPHRARADIAAMYVGESQIPRTLRYAVDLGAAYFPATPAEATYATTGARLDGLRRQILVGWLSNQRSDAEAQPNDLTTERVMEILRADQAMAARRAAVDGYRAVAAQIPVANGAPAPEWLAIHQSPSEAHQHPPAGQTRAAWALRIAHLRDMRLETERTAWREYLVPTGDVRFMTHEKFPELASRSVALREAVARQVAQGWPMEQAVDRVLAERPDRNGEALDRLDAVADDLRQHAETQRPEYATRGAFEARVAALVHDIDAGKIDPRDALDGLGRELRQHTHLHDGILYRLRQAESAFRQAAWRTTREPEALADRTELRRRADAAASLPLNYTMRMVERLNAAPTMTQTITPSAPASTIPATPAPARQSPPASAPGQTAVPERRPVLRGTSR